MKKILKTVFLAILAIIIITAVTVAVFIFKPESKVDDVRTLITDASGNTYVAKTDDKGQTYAIVPDSNGTVWKVDVNGDGSLGQTQAQLSSEEYNSADIIQQYTGPDISVSVDPNSFTGSVDVVTTDHADTTAATAESTTAPAQDTTAPSNDTTAAQVETTAKPNNSSEPNIVKYQKMFESGTYYMEFTTNDAELADTPIISAAKNGNILVSTTMEGLNINLLYRADKDKTYFVLNDYKKYCSVPDDLMGEEFDMSEMSFSNSFANGITAKDITTDTVEINGKTLTRESYVSTDGSQMHYYFDNGILVRLDSVDTDGATSETYITQITNNVPDSTFDIPKGYGYINLSWLNMLAGGDN